MTEVIQKFGPNTIDCDPYEIQDGFIGLINALFCASGQLTEKGSPLSEKEGSDAWALVNDAVTIIENAFCRADRRAYYEWAVAISYAHDQAWLPCDAWYEGELPDAEYRWLDGSGLADEQ